MITGELKSKVDRIWDTMGSGGISNPISVQAAFSNFLSDRSLTADQIRFIEMIIDQLTSRGIMEASSLYEPPFSNLHSGGPDELFAGKEDVIDGIFEKLKTISSRLVEKVG